MSKIFLEILDTKRRKIFDNLFQFRKYGYLAGGTALTLQINHRKSFDFDVFIKNPISNHLRLKAKKIFGQINFYVDNSDQISFKTKEGISITFVWYYYKTIRPLVKTRSLSLASYFDIAADKAHTIGRRAIWRDYVDFFFLLKRKIVNIEKIIKLAKKKFGNDFNEVLFLEQLSYFGDLKETPIQYIGGSYLASEIKSFLENQVELYVKKTLKI